MRRVWRRAQRAQDAALALIPRLRDRRLLGVCWLAMWTAALRARTVRSACAQQADQGRDAEQERSNLLERVCAAEATAQSAVTAAAAGNRAAQAAAEAAASEREKLEQQVVSATHTADTQCARNTYLAAESARSEMQAELEMARRAVDAKTAEVELLHATVNLYRHQAEQSDERLLIINSVVKTAAAVAESSDTAKMTGQSDCNAARMAAPAPLAESISPAALPATIAAATVSQPQSSLASYATLTMLRSTNESSTDSSVNIELQKSSSSVAGELEASEGRHRVAERALSSAAEHDVRNLEEVRVLRTALRSSDASSTHHEGLQMGDAARRSHLTALCELSESAASVRKGMRQRYKELHAHCLQEHERQVMELRASCDAMLQANVVETATATSMASHQATLAIKNAAEAIVASGEAEVTGTVAAEMHERELEAALAESSCMYVTEEVEHEVETAAQLKASEVRMAELIFVHTSESARLKGELMALWACERSRTATAANKAERSWLRRWRLEVHTAEHGARVDSEDGQLAKATFEAAETAQAPETLITLAAVAPRHAVPAAHVHEAGNEELKAELARLVASEEALQAALDASDIRLVVSATENVKDAAHASERAAAAHEPEARVLRRGHKDANALGGWSRQVARTQAEAARTVAAEQAVSEADIFAIPAHSSCDMLSKQVEATRRAAVRRSLQLHRAAESKRQCAELTSKAWRVLGQRHGRSVKNETLRRALSALQMHALHGRMKRLAVEAGDNAQVLTQQTKNKIVIPGADLPSSPKLDGLHEACAAETLRRIDLLQAQVLGSKRHATVGQMRDPGDQAALWTMEIMKREAHARRGGRSTHEEAAVLKSAFYAASSSLRTATAAAVGHVDDGRREMERRETPRCALLQELGVCAQEAQRASQHGEALSPLGNSTDTSDAGSRGIGEAKARSTKLAGRLALASQLSEMTVLQTQLAMMQVSLYQCPATGTGVQELISGCGKVLMPEHLDARYVEPIVPGWLAATTSTIDNNLPQEAIAAQLYETPSQEEPGAAHEGIKMLPLPLSTISPSPFARSQDVGGATVEAEVHARRGLVLQFENLHALPSSAIANAETRASDASLAVEETMFCMRDAPLSPSLPELVAAAPQAARQQIEVAVAPSVPVSAETPAFDWTGRAVSVVVDVLAQAQVEPEATRELQCLHQESRAAECGRRARPVESSLPEELQSAHTDAAHMSEMLLAGRQNLEATREKQLETEIGRLQSLKLATPRTAKWSTRGKAALPRARQLLGERAIRAATDHKRLHSLFALRANAIEAHAAQEAGRAVEQRITMASSKMVVAPVPKEVRPINIYGDTEVQQREPALIASPIHKSCAAANAADAADAVNAKIELAQAAYTNPSEVSTASERINPYASSADEKGRASRASASLAAPDTADERTFALDRVPKCRPRAPKSTSFAGLASLTSATSELSSSPNPSLSETLDGATTRRMVLQANSEQMRRSASQHFTATILNADAAPKSMATPTPTPAASTDAEAMLTELASAQRARVVQERKLRDERQAYREHLAQQTAAASESNLLINRLKAREFMLNEKLEQSEVLRTKAFQAARVLTTSSGRLGYARRLALLWTFLNLKRNVDRSRAIRTWGELKESRLRIFDAARRLATSVGQREARRLAELLVFRVLQLSVRARRAARSGIDVHVAPTILSRADRREAACSCDGAVRTEDDAVHLVAGDAQVALAPSQPLFPTPRMPQDAAVRRDADKGSLACMTVDPTSPCRQLPDAVEDNFAKPTCKAAGASFRPTGQEPAWISPICSIDVLRTSTATARSRGPDSSASDVRHLAAPWRAEQVATTLEGSYAVHARRRSSRLGDAAVTGRQDVIGGEP